MREPVDLRSNDELLGRAHGTVYHRERRTERDVVIPPAFMITDADGATWTFGFEYNNSMEINVLRNDVDVGEHATRIEYRLGVVTIYGSYGRKRWTGRTFV